jgi:single-strand DNA-binding protein
MRDLNEITIMGRLPQDIETKQLQNNVTVGNFTIANNRDYKKDGAEIKNCNFIRCSCFGNTAEILQKYTTKGNRVLVSGELAQNTWEKDGQKQSMLEIKVINVQIIDFRDSAQENSVVEKIQSTFSNPFSDADVPF